MKQIFLLLVALVSVHALQTNSVITQEDLQRIQNYLVGFKQTYIGDSLYVLSSLQQIPDSDIINLKQKYCSSLPSLWEKIPECDCQKLNLAALTLKCEDKRRADLDYQKLSLSQLAYITRTLTTQSIPEELREVINTHSLECEDLDETSIILAKMQLHKIANKQSNEDCLRIMEDQGTVKINRDYQIQNLIEMHGAFIIANQEMVANRHIMKQHSELVFTARKYLTERQYHKYRPRMMFAILRSAIIMTNYERLIAPADIKLEKGAEQTLSVRIVNTLNKVIKENYALKLSIISDDRELAALKATYDEGTSRYIVIIPGELQVGDYQIKWSFNVPGFYVYSMVTKLTVMHGRLDIVRVEYDDGNNYQEVGRDRLGSAHFQAKETVGENARIGVVLAGLQSIVPRYIALNLYKQSQLRYTILGTVSSEEELVSFYFPKVSVGQIQYFQQEVAEETKFEMELVAGDRWVYNCPLYQKLGSVTLPGSKIQPAPVIPSKYHPKQLMYYEYPYDELEPPVFAVYGMIGLMVAYFAYFWILSRPLKLNCEKWNTSPSKSMQLGFVLCLLLIMGTMIAFFIGLKLIPTLQILALLALPTIFFISKALSGLQIIDY